MIIFIEDAASPLEGTGYCGTMGVTSTYGLFSVFAFAVIIPYFYVNSKLIMMMLWLAQSKREWRVPFNEVAARQMLHFLSVMPIDESPPAHACLFAVYPLLTNQNRLCVILQCHGAGKPYHLL